MRESFGTGCLDIRVSQIVHLHEVVGNTSWLYSARPPGNHRDAIVFLIGHPAGPPHVVSSAHLTVVYREGHQGIVPLARFIQSVQNATDLRILLLEEGVVGGTALAHVLLGRTLPGLPGLHTVQARFVFKRVIEAGGNHDILGIVPVSILLQWEVVRTGREVDLDQPGSVEGSKSD